MSQKCGKKRNPVVTRKKVQKHFSAEDCANGLAPNKRISPRKKKNDICTKEEDNGLIYPIDMWFLISEHILPEQIKLFSLICRSTHFVVNTPKFWISLYKRYYRRSCLPMWLQPHCLEVHHGLKATVIRALYHTYLPLTLVAQDTVYINNFDTLYELIGMKCLLIWIEKGCEDQCPKWIYKFKFKKPFNHSSRNSRVKGKNGKLRKKDDINANPEDGCRMLFIPCRDFIAVPCVSGYTLKRVTGFWKEVRLLFTLGPVSSSSTEDITLILSPCYRPSLIDWWHPMYHNRSSHPAAV